MTTIDRGRPGASATAEHQRRHDTRAAAIDERWGRFAGIVKFLSDDPRTTTAWAKGAEGERKAAALLVKGAGPHAQFLFDRKVPRTRGNIDLLAVAPTGVWVIDPKKYTGIVERRDVRTGLLRYDTRLFVNGRDQTKLVHGMQWQLDAVRRAMGEMACAVRPALCFVDADWKLFAKPFEIGGVQVSGPRSLGKLLQAPGPLNDDEIHAILVRLATALPPAVASR